MHTPTSLIRSSVVSAALLAFGLLSAGHTAAESIFPTHAGRIVYKIHGAVAGTAELVWTEGGKKFRQDATLKVGPRGQQQTRRLWAFADGKHLYVLQPSRGKSVLQQPLPKDAYRLGLGMIIPLHPSDPERGRVVGKGTVAGKPCQIREVLDRKIWIWSGVELKVVSSAPKEIPRQGARLTGLTVEATKVESAGKISAAQLKVPTGYAVRKISPTGTPFAVP